MSEDTVVKEEVVVEDPIAALQRQLKEQIEALALQRAEESKKFQQELSERNTMAEIERQERIAKHQKQEEEIKARRAADESVYKERMRETARVKAEAEAAQGAADAARKDLQDRLEELKKQIADQEFIEERHRKEVETMSNMVLQVAEVAETTINVEHPVAPDNKGDAVAGTDGLEVGPLMSDHLKKILRQAQRQ